MSRGGLFGRGSNETLGPSDGWSKGLELKWQREERGEREGLGRGRVVIVGIRAARFERPSLAS